MQFTFTEEQDEFRRYLRRFLDDQSPATAVRRLMETDLGYDKTVWKQLCTDLGLPGVQIPEAYGGQGFGFVELGIVLEEMGRALFCAPYFASAVMAANAILNGATDDQKRELLPDIASGEAIATLAVAEDNGRWDADGIAMTAGGSGGGFRLDGVKSFVLDGHIADPIIIVARRSGSAGDDGLSMFAVRADAPGLGKRLLKSADPTRKLARLEFHDVPATLLGTEGAAGPALSKTLDQAAVCLANEMVGGAERLRESALDYAMMRMQFGRSIASFQVTKHKSADMLLDVELAKSAAYYAAQAAADDADDMPAVASLAKACAAGAYMRTAIHTVQIHGGIGFTWDNDTHLWFKRAKSSEVFLGTPAYHRELMIRRWSA